MLAWISSFREPVRRAALAGWAVCSMASAVGQSQVEPGLEKAVNWKWRVVSSSPGQWISARPDPTPTPSALEAPAPAIPETLHEVKRGEALVIIARKYGLTAQHLKTFNALPSDLIRVGQVLRIPSREEALLIAPLPEPRKKPGDRAADPGLSQEQLRTAALQALMDRRLFSAGPINGRRDPLFEKVLYLYRLAHPEASDPAKLEAEIRAEVGDGFTRYQLRAEDFRFIAPPKAARPDTEKDGASPKAGGGASYEEMVEAPLLLYRTPWEFVAERFHCEEAFLKALNPHIRTAPMAGMEFRVPNVAPFAIESALREPLQPAPNTEAKAVIADLSLLQIFRNEALVAVMPISMARPGLRGKGSWTILNALLLPKMGTFQEPRERPQKPKPLFGQPEPEATPVKPVLLPAEQFLPPGPNNPAGVVWINLAKADSPDTLPYGLHGTSIPDRMQTHYGIGGIQMANWNIIRAVRLLPAGTELEWKQGGLAPAAAPAAVAN